MKLICYVIEGTNVIIIGEEGLKFTEIPDLSGEIVIKVKIKPLFDSSTDEFVKTFPPNKITN